MRRASLLVMASPRPVPPNLRVLEASACSNSSKSLGSISEGMPHPVSSTSNRSSTRSLCSSSCRARRHTLPRDVNLTPLPAKLSSAWRNRVGSPRSQRGTPSVATSMLSPLRSACSAISERVWSRTASRAKSVCSSARRPASIFDKSRMSLMMESRCRAASLILLSRSPCSIVGDARCNRWVRPRMAFIGVRISWLMLARNALFARLALSAAALATSSSMVRLATSSSR